MKKKHKKVVNKTLKSLEGQPSDVALSVALNIIENLLETHPDETVGHLNNLMLRRFVHNIVQDASAMPSIPKERVN